MTLNSSKAKWLPNRARDHEQGFTLIEALIAVIILIVGLVAVAQLLAVAAASNSTANQTSAAAAVASQELERLQTIPIGQLVPTTGGLPADITVGCGGAAAAPDSDIAGVGRVRTCWQITSLGGSNPVFYIAVRSQALGPFSWLTRSEFSTFRAQNGA